MRTCLNGHHVTEAWARVAWHDGETGYCPRCEEVRKIGSAGHDAEDATKSDNRPAGENWYDG